MLEEIRRAHRALAILRALDRSPGYACNDRVLAEYLDRLALGGTKDAVRASLDELQCHGALRVEVVDKVVVVVLNERGAELASGKALADGVAPPGPECPY